jgi:protein-tyrosine phosphatase
MAAAVLQRTLPDCRVTSAGLAPPVGRPADPRAVRAMAREGYDIGAHRARLVDADMIAAADLVLVMDCDQRNEIECRFPQALGKTFRFCEVTRTDIPDPLGCSQNMFSIVLTMVKQGTASWRAQLGAEAAAT